MFKFIYIKNDTFLFFNLYIVNFDNSVDNKQFNLYIWL